MQARCSSCHPINSFKARKWKAVLKNPRHAVIWHVEISLKFSSLVWMMLMRLISVMMRWQIQSICQYGETRLKSEKVRMFVTTPSSSVSADGDEEYGQSADTFTCCWWCCLTHVAWWHTTNQPIFNKIRYGKVACGPRKKLLDFGGSTDHVMVRIG